MNGNESRVADLEAQLAVLSSELETAKAARVAAEQRAEWEGETARSALEDMQHFVYAVSHDLRQPLRGVLTNAQLLDRDPVLRNQAHESTSAIIQGALEMNGLIERLLTYSRIASNLRRTIVPLGPVVQFALMNMGKAVTEAGARITYDTLPTVDVDDSVFSTLFQEVLTNSILYCRAEVTPEIAISAESVNDGNLVKIRDNGCGVKDDFLEKIFVPFQRLHQKKVPGHGLGLSICRKIMRAHGGKIWMESDGETTSTVYLQIPD